MDILEIDKTMDTPETDKFMENRESYILIEEFLEFCGNNGIYIFDENNPKEIISSRKIVCDFLGINMCEVDRERVELLAKIKEKHGK